MQTKSSAVAAVLRPLQMQKSVMACDGLAAAFKCGMVDYLLGMQAALRGALEDPTQATASCCALAHVVASIGCITVSELAQATHHFNQCVELTWVAMEEGPSDALAHAW